MVESAQCRPPRKRDRLAIEIVLVLTAKMALLYLIWAVWFSHPETRHMQLPGEQVATRLLTGEAPLNPAAKPAASAGPVIRPAR